MLCGLGGLLFTGRRHDDTWVLPIVISRAILATSTFVAINAWTTLTTITVTRAFFTLATLRHITTGCVDLRYFIATVDRLRIQTIDFRCACLIGAAVVLAGRAIRSTAISTPAIGTSLATFLAWLVVALVGTVISCFTALMAVPTILAFTILWTIAATTPAVIVACRAISPIYILAWVAGMLRAALLLRNRFAFSIHSFT